MADKAVLQKKIDELAAREWDEKAISDRINNMIKNGIPRKNLDPKELKANKAKILDHVQRLAEENNFYFKNCAQATAMALMEEFGLGNMENIKALTAFPSIGGTGNVCGGITGALTALGLFFGPDTPPDFAKMNNTIMNAQKYIAQFQEKLGFINCSDILEKVVIGYKINPGKSETEMMKFAGEKGFEKCGLPPGTGVRLAAETIIDSL